jgi:hypothetical protein
MLLPSLANYDKDQYGIIAWILRDLRIHKTYDICVDVGGQMMLFINAEITV